MNRAIQRTGLLFFAALLLTSKFALAQGIDAFSADPKLRIPADAVPARLGASPQPMVVRINGVEELLAPGATLRDLREGGRNIVLPAHLASAIGSGQVQAAVERDMGGQAIRIWILGPMR